MTFNQRSFLFLFFLLLLGSLLALGSGGYSLSFYEVCATLLSPLKELPDVTPTMKSVIFNVRLPRLLLAVSAGAGLAAAGAAFQALFSNPLATPDTLGVSAGSAFGASLGILLGLGAMSIQGISLCSGLASVALVYAVSRVKNRSSILMLILSGLVIAAFFSALISLVKYLADPQDVLPAITFWIMGSLTGATFETLLVGLPFILIGCTLLYFLRWKLNALSLPEDEARSLGIPLSQLRALVVISGTMITAAVVSMCGLIGWVGLLIPHFSRLLYSNNNESVLPASLLLGAIFVLLADTLARCATEVEIPVSILTSLIGAPVFIYLLRKTGGLQG